MGFLGPGWEIFLPWGEGSGALGAAGWGRASLSCSMSHFPTPAVAQVTPLLAGAPGATDQMAGEWLRRGKSWNISQKPASRAALGGWSGNAVWDLPALEGLHPLT